MPTLALQYPKLRVELDVTDRFVDIVQEGFDIALRDHFAPLPDSDLVQRRLGRDPVYLVAAGSYLARRGIPGCPEDVAGHDGLLTSTAADVWSLDNGRGETVEVRPASRFVANETAVLLEAATAGLGITCLPRKLCKDELDSGSLVRVLPEWTAGEVATTLLMPHRRGQLPSVRVVADFLIDQHGEKA